MKVETAFTSSGKNAPHLALRFGGDDVMDSALMAGFEVIALVTLMTVVMCPVLLWLLPNRQRTVS